MDVYTYDLGPGDGTLAVLYLANGQSSPQTPFPQHQGSAQLLKVTAWDTPQTLPIPQVGESIREEGHLLAVSWVPSL